MKFLVLLIFVIALADFGETSSTNLDNKGLCKKTGSYTDSCQSCNCKAVGRPPFCKQVKGCNKGKRSVSEGEAPAEETASKKLVKRQLSTKSSKKDLPDEDLPDRSEYLNEQDKCIKAGRFLNDCNVCICGSKLGIDPTCTKMNCHEQDKNAALPSRAKRQEPNGEAPASKKIVKRQLSTKSGKKDLPDSTDYLNEKGECIKAGKFMNKCNKCRCDSKSGSIPICTKKICPEQDKNAALPTHLSRARRQEPNEEAPAEQATAMGFAIILEPEEAKALIAIDKFLEKAYWDLFGQETGTLLIKLFEKLKKLETNRIENSA